MEIFRELFLRGERERLIAAAEAIEPALSDGWKRDREVEGRVRTMGGDRPEYCFTCFRSADRQAALVFLTEQELGVFYVANVIPDETGQLSHGEYNAILEEFYERFVRPCTEQAGVQAELTPAQVDLEYWLSPPAARKLRLFSAAANRNTGSSHPSDRDKWMDFVVAAHHERSSLTASLLHRWLIEVDGWPSEVADRLASEYESGRELLGFADGRRSRLISCPVSPTPRLSFSPPICRSFLRIRAVC